MKFYEYNQIPGDEGFFEALYESEYLGYHVIRVLINGRIIGFYYK